jgi:hypothetical protein
MASHRGVQVLGWAGLVLDAHMARLLLAPEAKAVVIELKDAVTTATNMVEAMQELHAYVGVLNKHIPLPATHATSIYQLEVIHI